MDRKQEARIRDRISEINKQLSENSEYLNLAADSEIDFKVIHAHNKGLKTERKELKKILY